MSSDSHPERRNPKRSSPDDAGESVPEDPGKTWVPDDRDGSFLAETEAMPHLPADTDTGALSSLGRASENSAPTERINTPPEEPPRQFGEYELIERVGGGGMGNVYKAHHLRLDRIVALKTLRAGTAKSELQLERFHREAKAAARLDHPNIVPCYEFGKFNGWHYLTMAFVAGESLQSRLTRGPLTTEEAARVALDLAKAVAHAHHQGVIHRDIKPGNVILGEDGRPRLTDFGIAKLTSPITTPLPPMQLTQVGQALGTPGYMAPEQSAGRRWEVGPSADIYGLGGVLVAALTGHHPGSHDSFETLAQSIPENLQTICDRCLAYRPQDRFASADQLVEALEKILAGENPTPEPPAKPTPSSEEAHQVVIKLPKAGLWKVLGAVALVLVSALFLGIWLGGWWKHSPPGTTPGDSQESNLNSQAAAGPSSPAVPVQCRLEVFVGDGIESYFPVEAPNSLPLRAEDQLFADAKVSRLQNAFLYVLRIDTSGKATLENKGQPVGLLPAEPPDNDAQRPPFEVKASFHDYLEIPRQGSAGMLTLVLLARSKPLSETETAEIAKALKSLPAEPQPAPGPSTFQRFSFRNSRPSETRDPLGDQHPVKLILREVLKQLGPYFEQMEAVSFAVPAQP